MKKVITLIVLLLTSTLTHAQIFNDLYKDFLKYGTIYAAGDVNNSVEAAEKVYVIDRYDVFDIPKINDNTEVFPFDYRLGIGIRKLARFDYERKPKNFYDGTETQLAFAAPTSAFQGLEYQLHYERERWRGRDFTNHHIFVKHTGKHHIFKLETREVGKINLNYKSAELRYRLPIGKKFSISAGAVVRGHDRAYGYNPIEIFLNETIVNEQGEEILRTPWYIFAAQSGYEESSVVYINQETGEEIPEFIWRSKRTGEVVAYSDGDFRENVFPRLMNNFNARAWDMLDPWMDLAPIVGFDFYHYKSDFWFHAFGNYILPAHTYIAGDESFSYLNRNNWGKGGLRKDSSFEQWSDYSFGASLGYNIGNNFGIFAEGEYSKMWDSKLFQTTFGINYTFK